MENEAVTIISAMIDTGGAVVEVPIRIAGEVTVDLLKKLMSVIWYACKQGAYMQNALRRGACSLDYLMTSRGTELQYCRIENDLKEEFLKDIEARGALYTILPDLNTEDDYFEIAFHTTDTPKVNAACIKYHIGETKDAPVAEGIIGVADYVNNASPDKMGIIEAKYGQEVKKEKKLDAPGEYTLTINTETLLAGEDKDYFYTYIPGTYDKRVDGYRKMIAVPKLQSEIIHDGQSIEYTLKLSDDYPVFDGAEYRNNENVRCSENINGEALAAYYNHSREYNPHLKEAVKEKASGPDKTPQPSKEKSMQQPMIQEKSSYQKTPYKRAAGFHNFNERSYDYDAMTLEFVRKLQEENQIKKTFTDDDIQYVTEKYYILKPEEPEGKMLILPKEDVSYHPDERIYRAALKDKGYKVVTDKQLGSGTLNQLETVNKEKAAGHIERLDARKAANIGEELVWNVKKQNVPIPSRKADRK